MTKPVQLVAIGASAGGIEAFRNFFGAMPADSGMAFVVVLHLSPHAKSLLPEIIGRWTSMTVAEAKTGDVLRPNHVLVVPAAVTACLRKGILHLEPMEKDAARPHNPIDAFFDSVAADQAKSSIGIIMSGTGHDGSLGLKALKLAGGVTMAQVSDGSVPEHSGMPDSAIATGFVDLAVGADEMPAHIIAIARRTGEPSLAEVSAHDIDRARLRICAILLEQVGHDFSQYKDKTFLRRVERRMHVLGETSLDGYINRIELGRDEALMLFRDLLIGVTQFFRDQATFDAMEKTVIPRLFEGKGMADTVRVWVPGCATGEEAYSLAILLREHLDTLEDTPPRVQIFATDIDGSAIENARAGLYPATLLDKMRPSRRARFFTAVTNGYTVNKEIRDLCTFSPHSLVRDPPFSRMDLVSCRNLLIYMDNDLQASVIPCFHYALVKGGILLLGSSETVVRHEALFSPLDKEHRIFERREGPTPTLRAPTRALANGAPLLLTQASAATESATARRERTRVLDRASGRVLERFAAPYAVVTAEGELLHYSSRLGNFLQPALGAPSRSVFDMARLGLNLPLRAALRTAVTTGRPVEHGVTIHAAPGASRHVTLTVESLAAGGTEQCFLIVFKTTEPGGGAADGDASRTGAELASSDSVALIARMDGEMQLARDELQTLAEEHDSALEEVRSANEELHSVNEELQSSNEELETSKEEMQSINEELQTVNSQLGNKIDEVDRANGDLKHLFESTSVATIFLDEHFIIRSFTPEVANIYNLIPGDRGRSLGDIVGVLDYDGLRADVARVLDTMQPVERRVSRRDRTAHYLCRINLYRSPAGVVEGTLVTFVEVTSLVRVESQQLLIDELNHRVKNMLAVVLSLATQSANGAVSLDSFQVAFRGRLEALSSTYGLLSQGGWISVELADIVREELRPFLAVDGLNVVLQGPSLALNTNAALVLGMVVHELATNAVKYGALSGPGGRVDIVWDCVAGRFTLDWNESGGPAPAASACKGFGTTLIGRSIEHELEGQVSFRFPPEGLRMHVEAPLEHMAHRPKVVA